ncbi:MAG: ATP-binding protein [Candidatus Bathyarchaeia archaeon]
MKGDETEILRILYLHNPWWNSGQVPSSKALPFKRRDFYKLLEELENPKINSIIGARRVGKTVLMYQLINYIVSNFDPQRAMYISLDDPYLKVDVQMLGRIFDLYSKHILKRPFSEVLEQIYIFLDEIQTLEGWELALKRWFDLGYRMKFFISGSSSVNILTGGADSLIGRIRLQIVFPFNFSETIRFRMAADDLRRFDRVNWRLRETFLNSIEKNDAAVFYSVLVEHANSLARDIDHILLFLQDYLLKGGYPEILKLDSLDAVAESLKTYLNLTIYKDIVRTFKIRDPIAFEELIALLARECGQRINYSELARTLGLKRHTLKAYIYFLKTAFLISESEYYSKSRAKRVRKEKKIYINDPGIRNAAAGTLNNYLLSNAAELGKIVEAIVADHCKRLKFDLEPTHEVQLFYWKNKGYETDIVFNLRQKPIPIEVKYKDTINTKDLKGISEFSEIHKTPFQILVTKEKLDIENNTILVPLWLFLLMC